MSFSSFAATRAEMPVVLPLEQRAVVWDRWLGTRLEAVVPALIRREKIDMWLVIAREYNEDPVFRTMTLATWLAARRRTILVFHDHGDSVDRLAVTEWGSSSRPFGTPRNQPAQWECLAELVGERGPRTIAVNVSSTFPLADGLTSSELEALKTAVQGQDVGW